MSNSQFDSVASVILGHFSFAVSIHARARVATMTEAEKAKAEAVSIHARARVATMTEAEKAKAEAVSIHARARVATILFQAYSSTTAGLNPRARTSCDMQVKELIEDILRLNPRARELRRRT